MGCLLSEWGVLSFAIMLLMEVNGTPPPLSLAEGDQLFFFFLVEGQRSEVVDSQNTPQTKKERQVVHH